MPLRGGEKQELVSGLRIAHAKSTVKVQLIYPRVNALIEPQVLPLGIKPKEESGTLCPDSPRAHIQLSHESLTSCRNQIPTSITEPD